VKKNKKEETCMLYKMIVFLFFSAIIFPLHLLQTTDALNKELDFQKEVVPKSTSGQSAPVLLVLQDPKSTGGKQQYDGPQKETTDTKKKKHTSPQQEGKKSSLRDFVPSEKIKADKAVDFPADI
jgi:hypothetical protein